MNGSYTTIPTSIARKIAQATLNEVAAIRDRAYEAKVSREQKRGKRRHGLFGPITPLTREEAQTVVNDDEWWGIENAVRGSCGEQIAERLLHACNLPGGEFVHISLDDAYYLHIPEEFK